jgi:PIN like domain
VPEALRAAGVEIRVHDELFPQGTEDVVWLREAGVNGWVVITRDDRIRYNQLEKHAVLAARLRFFSITSSSLTGDEAATLILAALADDGPEPISLARCRESGHQLLAGNRYRK